MSFELYGNFVKLTFCGREEAPAGERQHEIKPKSRIRLT